MWPIGKKAGRWKSVSISMSSRVSNWMSTFGWSIMAVFIERYAALVDWYTSMVAWHWQHSWSSMMSALICQLRNSKAELSITMRAASMDTDEVMSSRNAMMWCLRAIAPWCQAEKSSMLVINLSNQWIVAAGWGSAIIESMLAELRNAQKMCANVKAVLIACKAWILRLNLEHTEVHSVRSTWTKSVSGRNPWCGSMDESACCRITPKCPWNSPKN